MGVTTGTAQTRTEHATGTAVLGFVMSLAIPAAIAVIGIVVEGWGAIYWLGAILWGVVAAFAFMLFASIGKAVGVTRLDLPDLLGSAFAPRGSPTARRIGGYIHHANGALLAIAWAYAVVLVDLPATWVTGLAWGVVLWALGLLMFSTMGVVHPAIRRGEQDDPGPAGTNLGVMTPVGSLLGHFVYGAVLGFLYNVAPLV